MGLKAMLNAAKNPAGNTGAREGTVNDLHRPSAAGSCWGILLIGLVGELSRQR